MALQLSSISFRVRLSGKGCRILSWARVDSGKGRGGDRDGLQRGRGCRQLAGVLAHFFGFVGLYIYPCIPVIFDRCVRLFPMEKKLTADRPDGKEKPGQS